MHLLTAGVVIDGVTHGLVDNAEGSWTHECLCGRWSLGGTNSAADVRAAFRTHTSAAVRALSQDAS